MLCYSIIIPHHNCPQLLNRLLLSINPRVDTEIIIIDDNSDPKIVDFSNFPGINRNDVHIVFSKEKWKNAGYARNIGLSLARGKWLLFADSDDYYNSAELDALRDKYSNIDNIDIVYMNAAMIDEDGKIIGKTFITPYIRNYNKNRFMSKKVLRYGVWEPWNRMVRRYVVTNYNIKFDEIPVGNDQMFSLKCSKYCRQIAVESSIIYNYFKPLGRSATSIYRKKLDNIPIYVDLKMRVNQFYDEVNYPFKTSFIKILIKATDGGSNKAEYRKILWNCLKQYNYNVAKDFYYMIINQIASCLKIK